jgi:hypothetical protein
MDNFEVWQCSSTSEPLQMRFAMLAPSKDNVRTAVCSGAETIEYLGAMSNRIASVR